MATLPDPPPNRNDNSGWIAPAPCGIADWTLTLCMIVLAIPVVVVFGSLVWIIRACDHAAGKAGA